VLCLEKKQDGNERKKRGFPLSIRVARTVLTGRNPMCDSDGGSELSEDEKSPKVQSKVET
jgi:hypothetical protein